VKPEQVENVGRRLLALGGPPPGAGAPAPRLLLVGEKDKPGVPPLCSARTGGWLWEAVLSLGWEVDDCYAANATTADGRPYDVAALLAALGSRPLVLALGREAKRACRDVQALDVAHPQWHRRFRSSEGPAGYATLLREAGLPRGDGLARARNLFVGGASPAEAAERGGVSLGELAEALVREDWVAVRREHEAARQEDEDEARREKLTRITMETAIATLGMLGTRLSATGPAVRAAQIEGNVNEVRRLTADCKPRDVVALIRLVGTLDPLLPDGGRSEDTLLEAMQRTKAKRGGDDA